MMHENNEHQRTPFEIFLKRHAIFSHKKEQLSYLFVSTFLHGYKLFCFII